jgi:N-dimethylarginine dimethylaminohydrolase
MVLATATTPRPCNGCPNPTLTPFVGTFQGLLGVLIDEYEASAGLSLNVLAVAPRRCIAIDGYPKTVALMEAAGCEVDLFRADELCLPCEGGPTCLTRPLCRASG